MLDKLVIACANCDVNMMPLPFRPARESQWFGAVFSEMIGVTIEKITTTLQEKKQRRRFRNRTGLFSPVAPSLPWQTSHWGFYHSFLQNASSLPTVSANSLVRGRWDVCSDGPVHRTLPSSSIHVAPDALCAQSKKNWGGAWPVVTIPCAEGNNISSEACCRADEQEERIKSTLKCLPPMLYLLCTLPD